MMRILKTAGAILALAIFASFPSEGSAQSAQSFLKNHPRILDATSEVVAGPSEATVRVLADGKEVSLGTIVEVAGLILTKFSLIEGAGEIVVRLKDGKEHKGKVLGAHKAHDLALVQIDAKGLKAIEWRKDAPEPGDWLVTPGPGDKPLYLGVVSVAARKTSPRDFPGGPIGPPAGSGYLGVQLDSVEDKVVIKEVTKDSAAEKAGLKNDDLILAIDGKAIKDVPGMITIISGKKAGDMVKLKISREGEEKEIVATLAKRPAISPNRGDFQNNLGSELSKLKTGFPTILQHDTVIKPADCGGPIVDLKGRAVGINIARAGRVESYAVPVEAILSILPDLKAGKLALPKD